MTNRVVRIDDEDWAAYELACKDKGITRSADIRMHVKREVAAWRKNQRDIDAARNIADGNYIPVEAKSTSAHRPKKR